MKNLLRLPALCQLLFLSALSGAAQTLQPFENCPGVSVAVTRPGLNTTPGPYQISLIDSNGAVQSSGSPVNLQINGFGLNGLDGFLYGMHESSNLADPFLARLDKNGNFENLGTLSVPATDPFNVGLINTAAGTVDDKDNYYFLAFGINLQNISEPLQLFAGKVEKISSLKKGGQPINIKYAKVNPGTCADELLAALSNPLEGALQDIAFDPASGNIYTYLRAPGISPTTGKIAWFNPETNPTFNCIDPAQPNIPTNDLSGLYFGSGSSLFILTIDGKFYKADIQTGAINFITQSGIPLINGNLRGDMASCVGKKPLVAFDNCPGVSVAVTRPGINSTASPFQIFLIDKAGNVQPSGSPIDRQFNAFGLNSKDGFLYGMHESSDVTDPFFSRVDRNGNFLDIGRLTVPPNSGTMIGIINTAAATMDGRDNYYFTAIVGDTPVSLLHLPKLYLGTIENVSGLKEGDLINIEYKEILTGTCADEIMRVLSNPSNGLLQDISFDPVNGNIYTIIPAEANEPSPAKIVHFNPRAKFPVLHCINPPQSNIPIADLSGLFSGENGRLFILTTDGKYYRGNVHNGVIKLIGQTALPLLGNNLRGDMASCVSKEGHQNPDDEDDVGHSGNDHHNGTIRISPNPVREDQMEVSVTAGENTRVQMQILGGAGNLLSGRAIHLVQGSNQFTVDASRLHKGFYSLVLIYPSGERKTEKFLKL